MGKDRTGAIVACYLIRFKGLDADAALKELRSKRPRSIEELPDFESAIVDYHRSIQSSASSN